ncbi:hypothetical protein ACFXAF_25860 [Kitasatospora sp. NPDC059463]|uniref:hypothetical protein n=1 Tax=unclassified Kitasatospora TaxID=2633591 RepID=UPI0036A61FEA
MKNGTNPSQLRAQHTVLRTVQRLIEAAASRRAPAPAWTIHPDGTAEGRFAGPDAVVAINVWRQAIPSAAVSTARRDDGLEWTLTIAQGDVCVVVFAHVPFSTPALAGVTA